MGCVESAQPKKPPKGTGSSGSSSGSKRLLEEYSIGSTLGEGAFGVVSNCTRRSTGEQFAVKMVDKVETPVEAIKKEAETLQNLNHPNIVKVHGVFFERCFVCIVMDKYSGGDLVEGLQSHLKDRGQINCHDINHVCAQMGASIQYLHSESIVHRDVKGDNYLMSLRDVTDPKCQVVLTDFGTAIEIKPGERLSAGVGTKIFWSPEFFDKDYGPKVDVWAMGVIMYGLVTGRFPFKDERDIRCKELRIPKRVSPVCEDFVKRLLEKDEARRLSADEAMAHEWLAKGRAAAAPAGAACDDADHGGGHELREALVNDGIKERRQELIHRLNRENVARGPTPGEQGQGGAPRRHHLQASFALEDKGTPGARFLYAWWGAEQVAAAGLLDLEKQARPLEDAPDEAADLDTLRRMLCEHRINPDLFGSGEAKTLRRLAGEVHSGACRLMLDATEHKKLVRVVDVVVLRIFAAGQQRILVETEERYPDGRQRVTMRLPGTKKEPYENARQTAERTLREIMNIPGSAVTLDLSNIVRYEEETESPSYPGVRTVYRKEIVEGVLKTEDAATLSKVGLPAFMNWNTTDKEGNTKTLAWMTDQMAQEKGVKLKAEGAEVVSTLVRAPIGLDVEALTKRLSEMGIDVSKYGQQGKTISIKELSNQLIRGEATLVRGSDGQALRVVDVVVLIIKNPATGETLLQTEHHLADGSRTTLNRLPGSKCRPDENHFLSARRILRRQLEIDDDSVSLMKRVLFVEEEAASVERRQWNLNYYGGLRTVYRKRLVQAELIQPSAP